MLVRMPTKGKAKGGKEPVQQDEPEVDEKTGLRLWRKVHLRIKFEADLKPYVAPPPPAPSEEPGPAAPASAGKKAPAAKGKPAPAAKGVAPAGEPGIPTRTLDVSWAMLSGRMYKWASWPAEPTAEGAAPVA
eukprot:jgi/Tetstr1/434068/TSEL_023212.t1